MRRGILISIFIPLLASYTISQTALDTAKNFTYTDIFSTKHTLFNYLDSGKYVLLNVCQDRDLEDAAKHLGHTYLTFGCNQYDLEILSIVLKMPVEFLQEVQIKYGIQYPLINGEPGNGYEIMFDYEIKDLPTTILIAPDRKIIVKQMLMENAVLTCEQAGVPKHACVENIIVTHPKANEVLTMGNYFLLSWRWDGDITEVTVEYTLDGTTWKPIIEKTHNEGYYPWQVPNQSTKTGKIRVFDASDGDPIDDNEGFFKINEQETKLRITRPMGGEMLQGGTQYPVSWVTSGPQIKAVDVLYSVDGGTNWETIEEDVAMSGNQGKVLWNLPFVDSKVCKVRVEEVQTGTPSDQTLGYFSIYSPPSIKIEAPNGGEMLAWNTQYPVIWESKGSIGSLNILYSPNKGQDWYSVVSETENDGEYAWEVPHVNSKECLIKIESINNPRWADTSDNTFSIDGGTGIQVTSLAEKTALSSVHHNAQQGITISFTLAQPELVSVDIFTPAGKKIASAHNRLIQPGLHTIYYDGYRKTNSVLGTGVFIVRVQLGEKVYRKKVTVTR